MANSHIQIMKPIRAPRDTIKSKAMPQRAPAVTSDRRLLPGLGPVVAVGYIDPGGKPGAMGFFSARAGQR
jgi:hypothetical protein